MNRPLVFASLVVTVALASPARAGAGERFNSGIGAAPVLSDAQLAATRGKYLPAPSGAAAREGIARRGALAGIPASNVAPATTADAPQLTGPLTGGTVTGLTVSMTTSWQRPDAHGVAGGYSAGVSIALDAAGNVGISAPWSAQIGSGLGPTPATGSISGDPFAGLSGIGQAVQIAGSGNDVVNQLHLGSGGPAGATAPPNASACGAPCSFSATNGLRLAIAAPGGVVAQAIGPQGVTQTAQLVSDLNAVLNRMSVNFQTSAPGASAVPPSLVRPPLP